MGTAWPLYAAPASLTTHISPPPTTAASTTSAVHLFNLKQFSS